MALPYPHIPDLQPENWIDLELLGSRALDTYIDYDGLGMGSRFWVNWRGCGAQGEIVDLVESMRFVVNPGPLGEYVPFDNDLVMRLDQGWVFYSYRLPDPVNENLPGEESLRRFFYVGKRDRPGLEVTLGVAQFKESHDLRIGLDWIVGQATVVTPAYSAMLVGDRVTLKLQRYSEAGDYLDTLEQFIDLTTEHLGQPLEWTVLKSDLAEIENGFVDASYTLAYATPTIETSSPVQRLQVVANVTGQLPVLKIKGFTGSALDPEDFPNGAILQVPLYPGIQAGDVVVLYADSLSHLIKTQRADPSTLDSEVLEFTLDHAWLVANTGQPLRLTYEHARLAWAGSGETLTLMISKPLDLPVPIVEGVTGSGSSGYLNAVNAQSGVYVRVPDSVVIGDGDQVQMHWQGHGSTGNIIVTEPEAGSPWRFFIPAAAVPANMGKRLDVFYQITVAGDGPFKSDVFDLEIRMPQSSGWPIIYLAPPFSSPLSLASVPGSGAILQLDSWYFMAAGQRVNIRVTGLNPAGLPTEFYLRNGSTEWVTPSEAANLHLRPVLPLAALRALRRNTNFTVHVKTSFDEGATYVTFQFIDILLID